MLTTFTNKNHTKNRFAFPSQLLYTIIQGLFKNTLEDYGRYAQRRRIFRLEHDADFSRCAMLLKLMRKYREFLPLRRNLLTYDLVVHTALCHCFIGKWEKPDELFFTPMLSDPPHPYLGQPLTTGCPNGWRESIYSGTCIKLFHENKSWRKATRICRSHGSELVRVINPPMADYIDDQTSEI